MQRTRESTPRSHNVGLRLLSIPEVRQSPNRARHLRPGVWLAAAHRPTGEPRRASAAPCRKRALPWRTLLASVPSSIHDLQILQYQALANLTPRFSRGKCCACSVHSPRTDIYCRQWTPRGSVHGVRRGRPARPFVRQAGQRPCVMSGGDHSDAACNALSQAGHACARDHEPAPGHRLHPTSALTSLAAAVRRGLPPQATTQRSVQGTDGAPQSTLKGHPT